MVNMCKHGHVFDAANPKSNRYRQAQCGICRRRYSADWRNKQRQAGRGWALYTSKALKRSELRQLASELARGKTICEITRGPGYPNTQFYNRWTIWKNRYPVVAKRFLWLSRRNREDRLYLQRRAVVVPTTIIAAPENMLALLDAGIPKRMPRDIRNEIRQQLAIEILESRCSLDVGHIEATAIRLWSAYTTDYLNRWKMRSMDQTFGEKNRLTLHDWIPDLRRPFGNEDG